MPRYAFNYRTNAAIAIAPGIELSVFSVGGITVAEQIYIDSLPPTHWRSLIAKQAIEYAKITQSATATVYNEMIAACWANKSHPAIEIIADELNDIYRQDRINNSTAFLRHRYDPSWTIELTDRLSPSAFEAIANFVSSEFSAGHTDKSAPPRASDDDIRQFAIAASEPIDWDERYRLLRSLWPHRDDLKDFLNLPIWLINDEISAGLEIQKAYYHSLELPVASLHASFINSNIDTKKTPPYSPEKLSYFGEERKNPYPQLGSAAYLSINSEVGNPLPWWVKTRADLVAMAESKKDAQPPTPRAYYADDIYIFAPQINGSWLHGELVVRREECLQRVELKDIDTGKSIVVIELDDKKDAWEADVNLRIVSL